MSARDDLNLDALSETYQIVGELAGRDDARVLMARRKSDGLEVLVVVGCQPKDDRGNALSHLAADANLLASARHRCVLPVLDGQWLGTDAFATVLRRPGAPTLHEMLSRREDEFGYARIAMILRDVSSALEWARGQKVVHRSVTPETLFVEPGSDAVMVAFALTALPASGVPGPDADARTIARLARAMFTRSPAAPERDDRPLAELRPGLPRKVIDGTDAMLAPSRAADAPPVDIANYISSIAMSEALKGGEEYLEATRNIIEEQRRVHKEQLEQERQEHEKQLEKERKEYERLASGQSEAFAKERETFARQLDKEHNALDKERAALVKERTNHARDCEELAREREAHARDRAALLEERARQERLSQEQREAMAVEAAEFRSRAEEHAASAKRAEETRKASASIPAPPKRKPFNVIAHAPVAVPWPKPQRKSTRSSSKRREWRTPLAAAVVVALITTTALTLAEAGRRFSLPGTRVQRAAVARRDAPPARPESAGGEVSSPYRSIVPLPELTTDTGTLASSATDWTPPPKRREVEPEPVEERRASDSGRESYQREISSRFGDNVRVDSVHSSVPRYDTIYGTEPPRPEVMRPYPGTPGRATVTRVDTIYRRDTLPPP